MLPVYDDCFHNQHDWNAGQGHEDQEDLEALLQNRNRRFYAKRRNPKGVSSFMVDTGRTCPL